MTKLLPWGFFELNPAKQAIYNNIKEIIKKSYKKYWYVNIKTATVEANSTLLAKSRNEVSKQVFWLYGLKGWAKDLKPYSLRFDLTVPFARYILDNEEFITFPFKRYQMQNVFRWEKQQAWLFRYKKIACSKTKIKNIYWFNMWKIFNKWW